MSDEQQQMREDVARLYDILCSAGSQAWDCRDTARRANDESEKRYANLAEVIYSYANEVKGYGKALGMQFEE